MVTNRILDYKQLNECLDRLKNVHEETPIGTTQFGFPIRHFTYGRGENHVIITAGTHATELISNHYVIHLMERLDRQDLIDKDKYTLHFIPILNPEGTIVVTSAIRAKLKSDCPYEEEQNFCKEWYKSCKYDDENPSELKKKHEIFRGVGTDCLGDSYEELKSSVAKILKSFHDGSIIQWTANGNGVNLNDNSPANEYIELKKRGIPRYLNGAPDGLDMSVPNPLGTIYSKDEFSYEKENESLLELYKKINTDARLIGSIIFHSCGGLVRYLKGVEGKNHPWKSDISPQEIRYNENVAKAYAKHTGYRLLETKAYNTISSMLESIYPGTLLIELGQIRGNPFGQFINDNGLYDKMLSTNDAAIGDVIKTMCEEYIALYDETKKTKRN